MLFFVIIAMEGSVLFVADARSWNTEWRWALDWAGACAFLVGPLLAGFTAWRTQGVRNNRGQAIAPFASSTRLPFAEAGAIAIWALLAHASVVVAIVISCYSAGLRGLPPLGAPALQMASMVALAALGYALGQLSDSKLLPPVVGVGLFYALTAGHLPSLWFEVGGATAPLAGLAYRKDVMAAELVLFLGLLLLAFALSRSGERIFVKRLLAAVALIGVVVPAGWLSNTEPVRFSLVASEKQDFSCSGSGPELCLRRENSLKQIEIQRTLAKLAAAAGRQATTPGRFTQATNADTRAALPDSRMLFINPDAVSSRGVDAAQIAYYFVWNRACLLGDTPPPPAAQEEITLLSIILRLRAGYLKPGDPEASFPAVATFDAWSSSQQDGWISEVLAASDRCDYAKLPSPVR